MATLDVNGQTIGYAVEGSGTPLLLLHGTTMNRTAFDLVRGAMPTGAAYQYVMVEFPGSGESAMPSGPLTLDALVAQAHAVMTHLGHERYHVAGYSLGAVVAAALAATHPDAVRSGTLVSPWIVADARMRFTFGLWKALIATDPKLFMRYALADGMSAAAMEMMEPMLEAVVVMGADTVAPGSAAHLDLDAVVDLGPLLPSITAPTLVIHGDEDRWVDPAQSRELAARIDGAKLAELPGGHLIINEQAAAIAGLLHDHATGVA